MIGYRAFVGLPSSPSRRGVGKVEQRVSDRAVRPLSVERLSGIEK